MAVKKKPAKPIAGQAKETGTVLHGKAVKYMSVVRGQNPFICPTCKRELYKGIIYEYNNICYCKRNCFPKG